MHKIWTKLSVVFFVSFLIAGCQIRVSDVKPEAVILEKLSDKPKNFILLGAGTYDGDLTLALAKEGFKVKPISVIENVTELQTSTRLVEYKRAGFKYALKLVITDDPSVTCFFSSGHKVDVVMSVIDIDANETLAVIKQTGPNRECPPLTPVWSLLAEDLASSWR